jgi:hypothetical protein
MTACAGISCKILNGGRCSTSQFVAKKDSEVAGSKGNVERFYLLRKPRVTTRTNKRTGAYPPVLALGRGGCSIPTSGGDLEKPAKNTRQMAGR